MLSVQGVSSDIEHLLAAETQKESLVRLVRVLKCTNAYALHISFRLVSLPR